MHKAIPKLARFLLLALMVAASACSAPEKTPSAMEPEIMQKIRFDLEALNEDGLYGPPDGLRAMDYEFCIPAEQKYFDEVQRIDTTVTVQAQSPGRIGCSADQVLCIGNTHQENFREVLYKLASLPYVQRIEPSYFEK